MTPTTERIILDPGEVSTGRTEFDITPWIDHEGIDWGDAAISAFMSETEVGEIPVDFRIPNRQITIPLAFVNRGTVTAQVARARLQAKLALFQREGGWLKRVTNSGGTVYGDVVDGMFHATSTPGYTSKRDEDYVASATLNLVPEFYGNEITLGDHVETTDSELIFTETEIIGDMPGRVRLVVDNDQASAQTSLVYGFRSRNYDSATSAKLFWEVEEFDVLGATGTRQALSGASGGTVVRGTATTGLATIVYNSTFTHQGHYRVFARCYSSSSASANLWAQFKYSPSGETSDAYSVANDEVKVKGGSIFQVLDLGQVDIRKSPVGSHKWLGRLRARGSLGTENIRFDSLWFVPADEYSGVIRADAMTASATGNELRTEGYFAKTSSYYHERPIWGDLPRLPVPKQPGGVVETFLMASRGTIGDSTGIVASSDVGLADDISAKLIYRPSWLFVPDVTLAAPTEYYVATTGSNSNDGSAASPWLTLQYAVGAVGSNSVINVAAGSYAGFTDTNSGNRTVTTSAAVTVTSPILLQGQDLTLENLTIQGTGGDAAVEIGDGGSSNGVHSDMGSGTTLSNCDISCPGLPASPAETDIGVLLQGAAENITIDGCHIHECWDGIKGEYHGYATYTADGITITNNELDDHQGSAIVFFGWKNVLISGNDCHDIRDTETGLDHNDFVQFTGHAQNVTIEKNTCTDIWNGQMTFIEPIHAPIDNVLIENNLYWDLTTTTNTVIHNKGATNVRIRYNTIWTPSWGGGVWLRSGVAPFLPATDTEVYGNIISEYDEDAGAEAAVRDYNCIADLPSFNGVADAANDVPHGSYPGFVNAAGGTFTLQGTSLCKGAGDPGDAPTTDITGATRGAAPSIGAYQ